MVTLDFSASLTDLRGTPIDGQVLADILADFLATENRGNARKLFAWALDLTQHRSITVDAVDKKTIEEALASTERLLALPKAQILRVFDEASKAA